MKRCPQCLFLYPDSDERCDFDKTALEVVDEAAVDAATSSANVRRRKLLPIIAAVGLMLAVLVFAIYYGRSQYTSTATQIQDAVAPAVPVQPVVTLPSPSPEVSPSPSPSPSLSVKPSPATVSSSHSRATSDPVSTSGPGIGKRQGGKPVIMLTSGGKIDADEVWRTRDGVWYRRNGMVTLVKGNLVKAIVTR